MAKKSTTKKAVKTAYKHVKKAVKKGGASKVIAIVALVLVVAVVATAIYCYYGGLFNEWFGKKPDPTPAEPVYEIYYPNADVEVEISEFHLSDVRLHEVGKATHTNDVVVVNEMLSLADREKLLLAGEHQITVNYNGQAYPVTIKLKHTQPPTVTYEVYYPNADVPVPISDFNITDVKLHVVGESTHDSDVTVTFEMLDENSRSKLGEVGEQVLIINYLEKSYSVTVNLAPDGEDPLIVHPGDYYVDESGDVVLNNTSKVDGKLEFHFLELGNQYTGDSIFIKAGDTDVLIDAGSRKGSAKTLNSAIADYCTDGKLEYVIATHADQDHIAGFVGNSTSGSRDGVLYTYDVGTIIQFPRTDKNTTILSDYRTAVNYCANNGTNVYSALDCYNNIGGAKRVYRLSDNVELEVLYNYYYENKSSDENNYSVCVMINHYASDYDVANPDVTKVNHYLLTGDLEKSGEEYLVQRNELPHVVMFKAGHHGSPTSSNDCLLSVISPQLVCVCCCCGSPEYTTDTANMFPSQDFVNRVAPYTELVFVTTLATNVVNRSSDFTSMNGRINVLCDGSVKVTCSNNNTLLKDTAWFAEYRICPTAWKKEEQPEGETV